jgi:hypothetical protein
MPVSNMHDTNREISPVLYEICLVGISCALRFCMTFNSQPEIFHARAVIELIKLTGIHGHVFQHPID